MVLLMGEYLFVYGTLRPGDAPNALICTIKMCRVIGGAFTYGVLYDFGEYPGAVLDCLSKQKVFGTVLELPDNAGVLERFDEYEGFNASAPGDSVFVRVLGTVELDSGSTIRSWIYVYNGEPGSAPILRDGKWNM